MLKYRPHCMDLASLFHSQRFYKPKYNADSALWGHLHWRMLYCIFKYTNATSVYRRSVLQREHIIRPLPLKYVLLLSIYWFIYFKELEHTFVPFFMSVIIWLEHKFGHQWGFICLTVFWLNCDLKTSVKEYLLWYSLSSIFFSDNKGCTWVFVEYCPWNECQWIFIFAFTHVYTCCMFSDHKSA